VRARSVETTSTCQVGGNGLREIILRDTCNMIIDTWYDNGHVHYDIWGTHRRAQVIFISA
jgi:hypothetical protein